jgi:succinoglycan biosynthesis protein ExoA
MDGGSTDGTLDLLGSLATEAGLRIVNNPGRLQSAGVNMAARDADPRARILIRIDAHAIYDPGFVEKVARALVSTGAESVVVPLVSRPPADAAGFARAVACAQRTKLGNGGSAHRSDALRSRWIDHGHHAGFDLEFFRSLGGYDEGFATNEDAEYDARVHAAGGRVWLETSVKVWYSPRESLAALSRQYFRYGVGRASTILKHRMRPKLRQMFPVAALAANVSGLALAAFWSPALAVPLVYLLACVAEGFRAARAEKGARPLEVAAALCAMHMSWGAGFTCKVFNFVDRM